MRLNLMLVITALTLVACSGEKDDTGPVDTGTEELGPCGRYSSAWRDNADWVYALTAEGALTQEREGGWEYRTMGQEEFAGTMVYAIQEKGDYTSHTWPEDEESRIWRYACGEDGMRLVHLEGTYSRSNDGVPLNEEGWWSIEVSEKPLVLPAELEVGQTWSFETGTLYSAQGTNKAPMSLAGTYEVLGEGEVTVPAGTFQAMQVQVTWEGDPRAQFTTTTEVQWLAPDVGLVAIENMAELSSYELDPEFNY